MIFVVEGDASQFRELLPHVPSSNMEVRWFHAADGILAQVLTFRPCILLTDLIVGQVDAIDIIKEIDSLDWSIKPIIAVLGERKENYVEIEVLNAGADDYMVKPVNKRVFASRLGAWMRRVSRSMPHQMDTLNGTHRVLNRERFAYILPEGEVTLQRKEFDILALLSSRPRKVFTREEIKEMVWGRDGKTRDRTIDVHITNLRAKIGEQAIRTHKGIGYSYEG